LEGEHLTGKRDAAVIEHRTRNDWVLKIKQMLDERHSGAIKARLVMDNLNIHSIASLYEKHSNPRKHDIKRNDRTSVAHQNTAVGRT
jgi:hypothetical protein